MKLQDMSRFHYLKLWEKERASIDFIKKPWLDQGLLIYQGLIFVPATIKARFAYCANGSSEYESE